MTDRDSIDTAIQREMLQVALRNSARSAPLLIVAMGFLAWLGFEVGRVGAATATLLIGLVVAAWRWWLQRRWGGAAEYSPEQASRVVLELEANAVLAGLMWVVATDRDIRQELERVIDDVGNEVGVVASALVGDEFLDAAFQLRIDLRFIQSIHAPRVSAGG